MDPLLINPQLAETKAVSTSVLVLLGTSNWTTLPSPNAARKRILNVCNCSAVDKLYVCRVRTGTGIVEATEPTSSNFDAVLQPEENRPFYVPDGFELLVVRAAGAASANVRVQEELF